MDMRAKPVALIALCLIAGVAAWVLRGRFPSARDESPAGASTPEERLALLENSLRALEDGVRDAPRDRWDPAYVVALVGRSPDSLYHWVQDNTTWIPYRGTLRGPVGVLMDRQGNSLDRALLLAELLQRAGHSVRLARTVIPYDRAADMLPEQAARRPSDADADLELSIATPASIPEAAEGYGLDGNAIGAVLESYDEATAALLSKVEERVASQAERLLTSVDGPEPAVEWAVRADSAVAMLRDHWWVQQEMNGSWRDLDLAKSDTTNSAPMEAPVEFVAPTDVDSSLQHRVTIRVVTERLTGGRLVEARALEHALRPSDLIGRPITLQFWPTSWNPQDSTSASARSLKLFALEQDQWRASLLVGSDAVAEVTLDASTRSADRGTRSVGGLGSAMARALEARRNDEDSLLTAVSIEYAIHVPGRMPRVLRRSVFDLIGPAARHAGVGNIVFDERQRLERSLSLMMRTEILPVVAEPDAGFVTYLAARSVLANADLLRAVSQPGFGVDAHRMDSLLSSAQPGVGPLYALAGLRHHANGTAAFLDQPAILTRHRYPRMVGDSIALADATDIVANELGIALGEADGFAARVVQGVWDTNLEALLGLAGGPIGNAAAAFDATGNWLALSRDDRGRVATLPLPADALAQITHQLDSGYTVVVPESPVTVDGQQFTAWWRVRPETGDALGIGENGWGQGSEYSLTTNIMIVGARSFAFEYGLCQFIPQAANSLRVIGGEFWRLGIAPSWTRPPEPGKDFEDVAVENNRMCLKAAMLQGFLATAPLLIATARYKLLARAQRSLVARDAIARMRQSTKYCLCLRGRFGKGPAGGQPGLTRAQARGGPIVPRGGGDPKMIDPLGKTQPGGQAGGLAKTQDLGTTQSGAPTPRTMPGMGSSPLKGPYPASLAEAEQSRLEAYDAYYRAADNASEKTGDWIRYRFENEYQLRKLNPDAPIPDFLRDDHHAVLEAKMGEAAKAKDYALTRSLEAEKRLEWAKDAVKRGELPRASPTPSSSPCNPSCGGAGSAGGSGSAPASSPSGSLEAGSAGVASSFLQGRWPTGSQ